MITFSNTKPRPQSSLLELRGKWLQLIRGQLGITEENLAPSMTDSRKISYYKILSVYKRGLA